MVVSRLLRKLLGSIGPRICPTTYFEHLYVKKADPWSCRSSDYEQDKYQQTLNACPNDSMARVLELGCGEGTFTSMLAPRAGEIVAVDISETALSRARERCSGHGNVQFDRLHVITSALPANFSLIIAAEVLYYFGNGKTYERTCRKLVESLANGGTLVAVNPWPASVRLGKVFPPLGGELASELVVQDAGRPYAVSVFRTRSYGSTRRRPGLSEDRTGCADFTSTDT